MNLSARVVQFPLFRRLTSCAKKSSLAADHSIQSRHPVPSSLVAQSSTVPSSHHTTAICLSLSQS